MSCESNTIFNSDPKESPIILMARTTLDFSLEFFLDDEETEESTITGSRFDMVVRDSNGVQILALSTDPGKGLTIVGYNELDVLLSADDTDLAPGTYRYTLQQTIGTVVVPQLYGDFVITPNENPAD